ncbi:MAG: Dam family site-specific DNA-(adenine-N6)-methyltransferase [Dehalococcoidia bacterium]
MALAARRRHRLNRDPLRPPLKWAGGKRWLVPHIEPMLLRHRRRRLVEPFCGGLAVTMSVRPTRALANDVNEHAIHFYRWLQRGLRIDIRMENDSSLYYQHRARFNELIVEGKSSSRESSELFYYLNRTCYNGLCRFNRAGFFNVPFGRYSRINYVRDFRNYSEAFRDWEFTSGDFSEVEIAKGDIVYADPPYDVEFTQYSSTPFGWDDQVRLGEWLSRLRVPVILSNQATPRIVRLYEQLGFRLHFLDAPRMISRTGDRTRAPEVLATRGL